MEPVTDLTERFKELAKRKRKLLITMKRARRTLARARVEKKKVNAELGRVRKAVNIFGGLSPEEAARRVSVEIKSTGPEHIYPNDLEKEFDRLDRKSERNESSTVVDAPAHALEDDSVGDKDSGLYGVIIKDDGDVIQMKDDEEADDDVGEGALLMAEVDIEEDDE